MKINTVKKFRDYLVKELDDQEFVIYTNENEHFENFEDNQISFHGEDEDEVFTFLIVKVNLTEELKKLK